MSFKTILWAFEQQGLAPASKLALVVLASFADESASCFPSLATIANMSGVSVRTAQRSLADLERVGLISRVERTRENGSQASSRYFLNVPESASHARGGVTICQGGGDTCVTGGGDTAVTPKNLQIEPLEEEGPNAQRAKPDSPPNAVEAADVWNAMAKAHDLTIALKVAGKRKVQLEARLREIGPDAWRLLIEAIPTMPFLLGKNDRRWKADLDWIVNPANFAKILEGKYRPDRKPLDLTAGKPKPAADPEARIRQLRALVDCIRDGDYAAWSPAWTAQLGVDHAGALAELALHESNQRPQQALFPVG